MAKDWMDDLSESQVRVAHMVADEAERQGVPVQLALAAAMQESSFQQLKKSGTGPQGVMMVGKAASKDLGINPKEVNDNIRGGITYLKQQLDTHNGDYDKALVAYHDGPNSPYVKGTGPMSPAAENHIAKVKEYGGYEGYQPAAAEEPVDTSVAPVEQINYVEPSASSEESSGTDLLAAGAGAVGGALISPHKPQSKHSIDLQLKERGQEVAAVRERNRAEKAMYDSEVRARDEAIALRKAALDASGKAAGADVKNYTQGQFGGNVPQTINPLDMGEAQSMGKQAVQAQRRVEQMMPGVQFDPTRGLLLPPTIQTLPKVEPQPLDFGIPKVAPLLQHDMPPVKPIYKGSMLGRAGTSVGGAAALGMGANAVDRAMEGDNVGASLGALSALGGAGTQARNPKTAAISGAAGLTALGAQMLYDKFKPKPKSVLEGYDKGGVVKKLAGAVEGALSNFVARPTQEVKFSEAIAPHEGKYLGAHMSDRFGTHGDRMGGTGFPNFQNVNPKHQAENVVWMNDSESAAKKLIENRTFNGQPMIHTNYIGGPAQHASNKTVHADVLDNFYKNLAAGKLTDEQIAKINAGIAARSRDTGTVQKRPFSQNFDIRDRFAAQEIGGNTMDSRRALSDMLGTGVGAGGPKNVAVPTYQDILKSHADPLTLDAPTSAMGTRLFEVFDEPTRFSEEFHPDYRWTVHGKDQGVQFQAVPHSVGARDFYNDFKQRFPDAEPHGNAWFAYPKKPQLITEDYIRNAQDLGFAKGGLAHC